MVQQCPLVNEVSSVERDRADLFVKDAGQAVMTAAVTDNEWSKGSLSPFLAARTSENRFFQDAPLISIICCVSEVRGYGERDPKANLDHELWRNEDPHLGR